MSYGEPTLNELRKPTRELRLQIPEVYDGYRLAPWCAAGLIASRMKDLLGR